MRRASETSEGEKKNCKTNFENASKINSDDFLWEFYVHRTNTHKHRQPASEREDRREILCIVKHQQECLKQTLSIKKYRMSESTHTYVCTKQRRRCISDRACQLAPTTLNNSNKKTTDRKKRQLAPQRKMSVNNNN